MSIILVLILIVVEGLQVKTASTITPKRLFRVDLWIKGASGYRRT